MPSGEGSRAPSVDRDPVAVLPVGLPADTVRVPVPAEVVAGGGLAEFVRGGVADSTGPVLLVSPSDPTAGVVVTPGQGSALAQGMGRDVVAMTQRQGGRGPQFTVFAADGSRPRPLAGPGAAVPAGGSGGVAGLAEASAPVPVASGGMTVARDEAPAARTVSAQESSVAAEGQPAGVAPDAGAGTVRDTDGIPVGRWSRSDLDREIARAKTLDLSRKEKDAAGLVVRRAHDVRGLARADAVVSLEDVVALVAAKRREVGDDRQDRVVEFSRALADRLGTQGSGLRIRAGAGPAQPSDVDSAPVPFGELMPPVDEWAGSELRGRGAEYAQGGSLPDVVDGRSVVLGGGDLAGVSAEGRAALGAFVGATGVAARPRLADVDGANVVAFVRMLDWWGVVDHALVVKRWKTTWRTRSFVLDRSGRVLVEEGTEAWYVMGEYAQGERPDSATRPEDLRDPLTQRPEEEIWRVPPHLDPNGDLPPDTRLVNIGESVEFFVHVVDPAGVRVEYGLADQGLWRRGREAEWGGLFAALNDDGPAELMNLVNPGVRRSQYLAQALGVDETTAHVWRMWSHLPEGRHVEALRRAVTGSMVSTYGGREEVKGLVEALVPDGARYQERLRVLGEIMVRLADRRRLLEAWGEEGRDTRSAAEYRAELREEVAGLGGLDQVVRAGSKPGIQVPVRELGGPAAPQRAGELGRPPSRRQLNVLHELVQALDGREIDYLTSFFGTDSLVAVTIGGLYQWRRSDRAMLRGVVLDTIVAAFGGPERAVALADRLRELGSLRGLQVFSQGQPEGPSNAARTVLSLPTMQEWGAWTLSDVVDYVAGKAVPAEAPDEEVARHLGTARAAELTSVSESTAQAWLNGRRQPSAAYLQLMREADRLPSSELVRYLGPGRALEVTDLVYLSNDESAVWEWLAGLIVPYAGDAGRLRRAVLGAITEGLLRWPQPLRRVVWSENGIREAERSLAWADATKGGEFPSDALSQWRKVVGSALQREAREVIDGLGRSLKASVHYIVVQVLLGNADARAMLEGSGIVIPGPGPGAATGLLEQIADRLRAARGMLDSGVLRRVVGGAASTRFQAATGGVVPQLRLTSGPDTVREFMKTMAAAGDVHFLVLRVPSGASQDVVRAEYVKGDGAKAFLASGGFFGGGQAHYFLDAVQGDVRRIDPDSTLSLGVMAAAGDALAWWARHGGLRASAQGSDGGGSAAPVSRGEGSQPRAADIILGGPEQVAWLDGRLPRVAELLDLPESERLERLGNLAEIAELAELAGRMEQHLTAMPPGFDPDGQHAANVERAKRMVRQGAWTTTDLRTVEDRLPEMRELERDLARSLRRAAADRELRVLSDQADAGLAELSGPARDSLLDAASEKLGAPLNGSPRAVSVIAHHMMGGAGDGEIAQVRDRLARIWVDLTAASAGGGPGPGTDPGAGPESVGEMGAVAALPGEAPSESTEDAAGAAENDGGGAGTFRSWSPESGEGFDPGSWLTEVALLPGDGARSSFGRDGGEVLPGRVDGAGAPVGDAEPSPGTPAGDAQVDAVIGKAEGDEFDTFMEKEQPGLLDQLERVGGKEVPSESSRRSTGSVVDGDAVSAGETGARRQAWPGVGTDQGNSPDGGARSIGDSSSSDSGSSPGRWSRSDLDREIARAKKLDLSRKEKDAAGLVVRRAHDVGALARADAVVSLEDVVALVAAKRREVGDDRQDRVVEFSRALADRLGTQGSGLRIRAGAGPAPSSGVDSAPVSFGELRPPVDEWAGSELRGREAEYAQGGSRGSLPDVVDGRSVVLGAEELAGVSEQGRAALEAFVAATGVAARPRLADVDGHNVVAFVRMLDWWGVADHALVVKRWKTAWRTTQMMRPTVLVDEGTEAWYVKGEYAQGERPDSATRPEDLWGPLAQGTPDQLSEVPPHLDPNGELPPDTWLENLVESVEFFVHVVDPAGVRVEYGPADPRLWRRGREAEWGELFAALNDDGPAELMNMVNPGARRNRYLAQALGVDETTAQVWRMWSHLPEGGHAEALRRAITGSVVSTYGGREEVKSLVEALVPDGARYQERLRALGQFMLYPADHHRWSGTWEEERRDTASAAWYRNELQQAVARFGGLDKVVELTEKVATLSDGYRKYIGLPWHVRRLGQLWYHIRRGSLVASFEAGATDAEADVTAVTRIAESKPGIRVQVQDFDVPAPPRTGLRGRQPTPRELRVLQELARDLDGRELDYLTRFFIDNDWTVGGERDTEREWRRGRPDDRAVVRGIVLDTVVAAFGGPEAAVALADRLRVLGRMMGMRWASQGQPEGPSNAARTVLSLPTMQEWGAWTLGDVVEYVAGDAVPAEVPDEEVVSQARSRWLRQPDPTPLPRMRNAARLSGSELVRYLGPGRAMEVTLTDPLGFSKREWDVWKVLAGRDEFDEDEAGKLRRAVLRAISDELRQRPKPLRRVVWNENGIREAERRLAWADATNGGEFPSDARSQWLKVDNPDPPLRPASREVIDGLGESLKASVNYIVVQVLLGNEDARAMLEGSGIVIPGPGSGVATGLLEQVADHLRRTPRGIMLDSGVLRRVVGGAASERFQAATGGVVPQLRLTSGPRVVQSFMEIMAADDVHFLVLKVPSGASQDVVRAEYVKGDDAKAFASGGFFGGGQAHYFLDAVQGDVRMTDPRRVRPEVLADAGAELAWWARHGGLHAPAQGSDGGGSAAPASRGEGSQPTAADIILGGPEQVAWLDGRLPRVAELFDLPESERLERLGNLAEIAELAELAGRMEQHLEAIPPGFDPDGQHAANVERAKRMVRQGAWTTTDLRTVEDRLPEMREVERGLARSLRRAAADRELRGLSDRADAGLAELSGPARDSLLDAASGKLGAPLNGSPRAVSVMAYHMMGGAGDGEIARVRDRLARIWVDLTAASAGAGPGPGTDPGAGPESVGDLGAVAALPGEARSESTEDAAGATENDGGGGAGTFGSWSPESGEGFDPGSWLTEVALLPGDGIRSSLGRDGGEVLPGRVDGVGAPVGDAEPSPGTPAGDAQVDAVIGKAESDEFDTFMEKEQPGLLDRLERVGGKEVPSESSTRSTGSVVDGDAVSTGETGVRRRQAWPGVGTDQGNFTDGGARSIGDSSSSDSGSSSPGRWSRSDLDREIARAKRLDLSRKEKDAAGLVVRRAHDVGGLARADAVVSLEDVVALVAAKSRELGDDRQDLVVEFSRALADRLGTQGSGLRIQAGAGPAQLSDVDSAPVPFGELKPLRDPADAWGSELRGGETEYAQGGSRGSLPDVVDGRSVVLGAEDLAGVSEQGRAALDAFVAATGVAARPRVVDVDGHNVMAFLRILDWWGVADHALVAKRRKTTWRTSSSVPDLRGRELVEEGTEAWYVMGEYAPGERPDSATRLEDLWDPLTQRPAEEMETVPPHLDPDGVLALDAWLVNIGESVEFFVHVVDPAGVRVEYGPADQGLWRRGREAEWGGLFAALNDEGPAGLMNLVNPGVRRSQYLAQAWGVDETTAQVWRMWSHLPEQWHVEALRRAATGLVVSTYGGREEVKSVVEELVPDGAGYQQRVRVLGEIMVRLADRRRLLEEWGEEESDIRSAAEYRAELWRKVAGLGGLNQVVDAGGKPGIAVPVYPLSGPAPQRAGELGRRPRRRELNVLHELAQALDGREVDYLTRFFGDEELLIKVVTGETLRQLRRGRPGDRAMVRGIVLDTVVEAFGGPERAVALADRLRELGSLRGLQVFSQGQPEGPSNAARTVLSLPTMQEWGAWTLSDVVDYVAGNAVPAEVPDKEVARHLGLARAAELTSVSEYVAEVWLDGRFQPSPAHLRLMRQAARLPSSELVRYLGPGRALEVTDVVPEVVVWAWLTGSRQPAPQAAGRLRGAVLGAITEGLLRWPQPLRRVVWSENGIREAERSLAWADATKGDQFPSDARSQWEKVDNPDPPLRPEAREVIDGLGKSLKASVRYIVVQVLLGNADARAMLEGSGIVIPGPGPGAATGLLEQIADRLRAARGMLDSGVLRRMVGGAASERFQAATGGVVPQLRLTSGPRVVQSFMRQTAADDVHFLVLRVPSAASQDVVRAEYVKGDDAKAFASGGFFGGGQAHYFLDAVQGDVRMTDPRRVRPEVLADAGAELAWWARHGGLHAPTQGSDGGGSAAPASRGEGSQPTAAADIILGGPEQVAWLDGRLPRVAELLDLPESERLERLGNLAGIAELAELAGRMEQHLEAMPPGFDPDGQHASTVERAKRMVRQGAWTTTDLRTVEDRLPEMRELERGLARSLRRGAADRELRGLSDQADAGLAELSGPARDSLLDVASEKLGAPLNGSPRVVSVMAYHMMGGAGDGEIARVRDRLARIWVDLTAASAGAGPGPGTDPGAVAGLSGDARSESTEDAAGATENDGGGGAGTFGSSSPESGEGFDPGSWLTEVALLPGDGARSSLGRDGGEVLPGRVDGAGAPVWDAEPSPGTPAGDAHGADAAIGKAESDEFDTFMEKEQPGLLDRLERVGGKEVPSESSTRSTGSVVDDDAVSAGDSGVRRRQAWPGVGTDQDHFADGGVRSIGDSSSSDSGSSSPGRWSRSDLDREIARAKRLDLSSGEREAAGLVVRRAHDVGGWLVRMPLCRWRMWWRWSRPRAASLVMIARIGWWSFPGRWRTGWVRRAAGCESRLGRDQHRHPVWSPPRCPSVS